MYLPSNLVTTHVFNLSWTHPPLAGGVHGQVDPFLWLDQLTIIVPTDLIWNKDKGKYQYSSEGGWRYKNSVLVIAVCALAAHVLLHTLIILTFSSWNGNTGCLVFTVLKKLVEVAGAPATVAVPPPPKKTEFGAGFMTMSCFANPPLAPVARPPPPLVSISSSEDSSSAKRRRLSAVAAADLARVSSSRSRLRRSSSSAPNSVILLFQKLQLEWVTVLSYCLRAWPSSWSPSGWSYRCHSWRGRMPTFSRQFGWLRSRSSSGSSPTERTTLCEKKGCH